MRSALILTLLATGTIAKPSSLWSAEEKAARGFKGSHVVSPLPNTYVNVDALPESFTWGNVNGTNYLTKNLNQHIPQYCGSCWAHAALSALGDRIKMARKGKGIDVNLAVQHVLNCGNAGSCHGGDIGAVYEWIHGNKDSGVVYDTCNPYLACSSESTEGFCSDVNTKCTPENICRTCSTFTADGGKCVSIDHYPNATVAEYGNVAGEQDMMAEIYARGPIGCGVDATQILNYHGGIAEGTCGGADHAISVVGWGVENGQKYWIVRNSWGEYWGEMGYFRVAKGNGKDLCVEQSCQWGTPGKFTETNFPCNEDGSNCGGQYVDPSFNRIPLAQAL